MKLFKPWLLEEYGKYFESDEVLIDKIVTNNVIANDEPENLADIFDENCVHISSLFYWSDTPEGSTFWGAIEDHTAKIIRKDY